MEGYQLAFLDLAQVVDVASHGGPGGELIEGKAVLNPLDVAGIVDVFVVVDVRVGGTAFAAGCGVNEFPDGTGPAVEGGAIGIEGEGFYPAFGAQRALFGNVEYEPCAATAGKDTRIIFDFVITVHKEALCPAGPGAAAQGLSPAGATREFEAHAGENPGGALLAHGVHAHAQLVGVDTRDLLAVVEGGGHGEAVTAVDIPGAYRECFFVYFVHGGHSSAAAIFLQGPFFARMLP